MSVLTTKKCQLFLGRDKKKDVKKDEKKEDKKDEKKDTPTKDDKK